MSTVNAAQVTEWGQAPHQVSLTVPAPSSNQVAVHLLATGVHSLVRSRASGTHYSKTALPHTPGSDGVGFIPSENNRKVYFNALRSDGSFRAINNVVREDVFDLPEGADPVQVAALFNPAMSSWLAVRRRTINLPEKFNVLILGATSLSGKVALPLLKQMGAGRVYGVARNEQALAGLGLDGYTALKSKAEETDWDKVLGEVDIVLDYLYGEPLEALLKALKPGRRVQVVQIGALVGDLRLPADLLRGRDVSLVGSGLGNWGPKEMAEETPELLKALKDVPAQQIKQVTLAEIEVAWNVQKERLVVVP